MIQILKQCLRTFEGIQRYKRFQTDFSENLLKNATNDKSREKLKKYQVSFIALPLKLR